MAFTKIIKKKLPSIDRKPKANFGKTILPDGYEDEVFTLDDFGILIYGVTGIGKSSLPSNAGKPYYLRFEQSSKTLKVAKSPILTGWARPTIQRYLPKNFNPIKSPYLLDWLDAAESNLKGYKTFIIDGIASGYDRCLEYKCDEMGIKHPGKMKDYGASWKEINTEFIKMFIRIAALDVGIWTIAHETYDTIETKEGDTYTQIQPNLSGKLLEFFKENFDIIGYYFYIGTDRYLQIQGTSSVMAKCNVENNFFTPEGKRIACIPMGNSKEEAYANFVNACNNEQKNTYEELISKGGIRKQDQKESSIKSLKRPVKKAFKKPN